MSDTVATAANARRHSYLETNRLAMHWLTPDDAGFMLSIWNDPAFVRHVGDRGIRTVDEATSVLHKGVLKQYDLVGYGPYKLVLRGTGTAIGVCGLFCRESLPDPDIGFALLPEFCGRGIAWEAASAVHELANRQLGLERLTAIVSPGNRPSIGLVEKLGMKFEKMIRLPGDESDVCLYGQVLGDTRR